MRGVCPKIITMARCFSRFSCIDSGEPLTGSGRYVTTNAINDAKIKAPKPAQITFRERA
jgi:hypothetical protein